MKFLRFSSRLVPIAVFILPLSAQTNTFPSSGNVGIGTTGPTAQLHIEKTVQGGRFDGLFIKNSGAVDGANKTRITLAAGSAFAVGDGATYMEAIQTDTAHNDLAFGGYTGVAGGSEYMRIQFGGNVGVGTTAPGGRLQILSPDVGGLKTYSTSNGFGLILDQYYSASTSDPGASFTRTADIVASTGDISSSEIRFLTKPANSNPAVAMFIGGAGNVGIGTTNPTARLTVSGGDLLVDSRSVTGGNALVLKTDADNQTEFTGMEFRIVDDLRYGAIRAVLDANGLSHLGFLVGDNSGHALTEDLAINSLGNVGIGTSSPGSTLHVHRSTGAELAVTNSDSGAAKLYVGWDSTGGGGIRQGLEIYRNYGDATIYFNPTQAGSNISFTNNVGNVGIGTTNPTQKLSVNGTVRAKEVIVDTGWSDYVFADSYKLEPLSSVEATIKAQKHLPGIPSAREVAKEGIGVGEMQAKLLAKIEELTLHVIAQQRQINAQQADIAKLMAGNRWVAP